jgi:hypothetical protein
VNKDPKLALSPELNQLLRLAGRDVDLNAWLAGAESAIEFVKHNARGEWIVLYACLPHVLIHCVLAPLKQLAKPDRRDLSHDFVRIGRGWHIEHLSGGGRPDRVYLASALADEFKTLKGGEKLVFQRSWAGAADVPTEISQRLVHALDLHYVDTRSAYCRLDEQGDVEDVIKIIDVPSQKSLESILVVTIRAREFYEYARLARMGMVFFFDFTRYLSGTFSGWSNPERFEHGDADLFYNGGVESGNGSYVNGRYIFIPPVTLRQIVSRYKERQNPSRQRYASFKILELKTGKRIETSCDPKKTSNYFQPKSPLPLEMSPAFFRAEVIHRYKADKSKYRVEDRKIRCRGTWALRTYDVNEAGQVHTYLRYLAELPYQEQLYWQSFNEWPKGTISKRAWRTDFEGEWSTEYEPLRRLGGRLRASTTLRLNGGSLEGKRRRRPSIIQ